MFFLNWFILELPVSQITATILYITTLAAGYIMLLLAGLWMSRLLKNKMMDDVFNHDCARMGI